MKPIRIHLKTDYANTTLYPKTTFCKYIEFKMIPTHEP